MLGAASTSTQRWVAPSELGVVAERVADEVGELGEGLHTCVAGSDEDEGQVPLGLIRVGRGRLELAQDVVS